MAKSKPIALEHLVQLHQYFRHVESHSPTVEEVIRTIERTVLATINQRNPTMTSQTSFEGILSQQADDVKPPPLLPVGTYSTVVAGLPEQGKSSQKQTDFFKFTHRIIAADDDVDQDELAEAFPDGLVGKTIDNTFYITEKSAFMLVDFVKNCGVETSGKTLAACIDELPNSEVKIFIKHEPVGDTGRFRATIARTLPPSE